MKNGRREKLDNKEIKRKKSQQVIKKKIDKA